MQIVQHNPGGVFPLYKNYCHAIELKGSGSLLVISGLNGYLQNGQDMPESFEEQAELIWQHMGTILKSAGMDYTHLISLRFYLADPAYDEANVRIRVKYLGNHRCALTVICCRLLNPEWKLEIEAMAAKQE